MERLQKLVEWKAVLAARQAAQTPALPAIDAVTFNSRVQSGSSADEPVDWQGQSAALVIVS
jgi:hypothetical protein